MVEDMEQEEIASLLEVVYEQYGYDFRDYSEAHIKRRILNRMSLFGLQNIGEVKKRIQFDKESAGQLLRDLSITVTEMFRDHDFYKAIRREIVPVLRTYPFIKIWHAGCATGEEVYSMAILLKEEGLYDRTTIYATDFNQLALQQGKEGIYSNKTIKEYTLNYQRSGGNEDFSIYYTSDDNMAIVDSDLKKNIVWANHNLVTDHVFASVNIILCRNVMIYFNTQLQNKVHELFFESLIEGGFLCLGAKEGIKQTNFAERYSEVDKKQRIFKKRY